MATHVKVIGPSVVPRGAVVESLEARRLMSAVNFVIQISVDGLRPDAVTTLGAEGAPNFYRLRAQGAFTDNARTDFDWSITLPNHTGMVTGRGVDGPAGHNYTGNVDPPPGETLHTVKGSYLASTWDVAHDRGLRTGLFSGKTKFSLYDTSYDADAGPLAGGAPDVTGVDNGRDKIDVAVIDLDHAVMTGALIAQMTGPAPLNYAFVHYADPDVYGHLYGWMGPEYLAAVSAVDAQIGRVMDMVSGTPALAGRTTVIVSADHGGPTGLGDHRDPTAPQDYTVPFYVWGAGVTAGANLYALNPAAIEDPGAGRPDYAAARQPIRNADGANLAMGLLGLPDVPGSTVRAFRQRAAWAPDLAAASDLGLDAADDLTSDDTPTFTGVAPAGSAVELVSDGVVVGTAVASAGGAYAVTASPLADGTHAISAAIHDGGVVAVRSYPLAVTVDRARPRVAGVRFDGRAGGAGGHVHRIAVTFDEMVGVGVGDLVVRNDATGATVPASKMSMTYDGRTNVATWSFPGLPGGAVADGNYTAAVRPAASDAAGNAIAADARTFAFFQLSGDANGDRVVDRTDFFLLYASPAAAGDGLAADFDGDGRVGFADYQIFELNYGRSMPAPVPAAVAAAPGGTLVKAKGVPELPPARPTPAKAPPAPVRKGRR